MAINRELKSIVSLYEKGDHAEVVSKVKPYLIKNRDCAQAWNLLALSYRFLGDTAKTEELYSQLILKNPFNIPFKTNYGNLLMSQGRITEAEEVFRDALRASPQDINTLNGYGLCKISRNDMGAAKKQYDKILAIDPDHKESKHQLATIYRKIGDYNKAADLLGSFSDLKSKVNRLDCLYYARELDTFRVECEALITSGARSPLLGALIQHANVEHDFQLENTFCENSKDYVLHDDLIRGGYLSERMLTDLLDYHDGLCEYTGQPLLEKGQQTSGNVFDSPHEIFEDLSSSLKSYVDRYRDNFKSSSEGFIKRFPDDYKLYGWFVEIEAGGKLKSHMHKEGWLSAAFYLRVPNTAQGAAAIEFTYDGGEYPSTPDKYSSESYNISKGEICMFPSSLFHRTKPFSDDTTRISFAFDVQPRDNMAHR